MPPMTQRLWIATRKGLFAAERRTSGWHLNPPSFLGDPVTMVLDDERDGTIYAALNLGHFGSKLHRSTDNGHTWEECAVPSFAGLPATPPAADATDANATPKPPTLEQIWALEAGSAAQPGRVWAGHHSRRAVSIRRSRCVMVSGRRALERARACQLVRRRLRRAGHSFNPRRSAQRR